MSIANDLTTILLLLLTFFFTTMTPTVTIALNDDIDQRSRMQQQHAGHIKDFTQPPTLVLTSTTSKHFLLHNTGFSNHDYVPINIDSHRQYSVLKRSTSQHQEHHLHKGSQKQQINNVNMLDYRGPFVETTSFREAEHLQGTSIPLPAFDYGMQWNITARAGQTAAINCRVENLNDKSVSWIRKRDLHILTAGILTYTSDQRFQVIRSADSKDWTLQVKYAQIRDSGIYECQVNTEPKISMAFRLNVVVITPGAQAIIAGPSDLYVKVGSAVTLTCTVKQSASKLNIGPIYWYRANYVLTPFIVHPNEAAIDMMRISMDTKLGLGDKLLSRLRIASAQPSDSGNYTCMPTTAEPASVNVVIIHDESPAAMQKSAASHLRTYWTVILFLLSGLSLR